MRQKTGISLRATNFTASTHAMRTVLSSVEQVTRYCVQVIVIEVQVIVIEVQVIVIEVQVTRYFRAETI